MCRMIIAAFVVVIGGSASAQEGDPEAGQQIFRRCQACHSIGEGAENKVGPRLNGVVGAGWAHVEDYDYSQVMVGGREEGRIWDEETLHGFLENPRGFAPGTKMIFPGLRSEEDRANVIAFLAQFDEEGGRQ